MQTSVDLVAGSRCDRRDREAGAARDGFERGEQGPMPRGRWQSWPEWAHDAPQQGHTPLFQDHSSGSEDVRAGAAMGGARDGRPRQLRIFEWRWES